MIYKYSCYSEYFKQKKSVGFIEYSKPKNSSN